MSKILIIGQNGQVSTYLQRVLSRGYEVQVLGSDQLNLTQPDNVYAVLDECQPAMIINPAAFTAVDLAEEEQAAAFAINRDSVVQIARYCQEQNTPLIHYSTDYVFDGQAQDPYTEEDATGPTGVYGQSKLEGEQAIQTSGAPALILRTSWVYSNHGKNFYKTMLSLAESRDELSIVADQIGAPTYAGSIAQATKELVDIILQQGGLQEEQIGVYHFSCQGQTSWCEFAKALFRENDVADIKVHAITTSEYPTPAKRPAFSVLDGAKLNRVFGVSLPHWGTALAQCAVETESASD